MELFTQPLSVYLLLVLSLFSAPDEKKEITIYQRNSSNQIIVTYLAQPTDEGFIVETRPTLGAPLFIVKENGSQFRYKVLINGELMELVNLEELRGVLRPLSEQPQQKVWLQGHALRMGLRKGKFFLEDEKGAYSLSVPAIKELNPLLLAGEGQEIDLLEQGITLEIYPFETKQASGLRRVETAAGTPIYLPKQPLIATRDIEKAVLSKGLDLLYQITIRFEDRSGDRFYVYTGNHLGQSLAVLMNGQILATARIVQAIEGGELTVSLGGVELKRFLPILQ